MLQANINAIKTLIEDFKTLNLPELFAQDYAEVDIANVQLSRFSIGQFLSYTNNFFEQFEIEINNDAALIFPQTFTTPEFGSNDLQTQISSFLSYVRSKQFPSAENILGWLLIYQLQNGFYNKSQYKLHPITILDAKKLTI